MTEAFAVVFIFDAKRIPALTFLNFDLRLSCWKKIGIFLSNYLVHDIDPLDLSV